MTPKVGESRRGNAGKGRKKGSKNKLTVAAKLALETSFNDLGGVSALTAWAQENRTEFYKLWGKIIPKDVEQNHSGEFVVRVIRDDAPTP